MDVVKLQYSERATAASRLELNITGHEYSEHPLRYEEPSSECECSIFHCAARPSHANPSSGSTVSLPTDLLWPKEFETRQEIDLLESS